ncbi:MAG: MOSC domain-containing protein [Hyphomicrobiales bacterium]
MGGEMRVKTVSKKVGHNFSKDLTQSINLLTGLGVEGDAHMGVTVKHRSRVAVDPTQPNLRQVHLIQAELFTELLAKGFEINAGDMGENITTCGIDLLGLPQDTLLEIGETAVVRVTGLRNPCGQIESFRKGLLKAVLDQDENGDLIRKAGVMAVVVEGGIVQPEDEIIVKLPAQPHLKLERV